MDQSGVRYQCGWYPLSLSFISLLHSRQKVSSGLLRISVSDISFFLFAWYLKLMRLKRKTKEREREKEGRKTFQNLCSLRTHLNQLIKPVHFLSMCFFFLTSSSNFHPSLSLLSPDTQFDSHYFLPFFFSFHKFTLPPLWMRRREKEESERGEQGERGRDRMNDKP